MGTNIDTIVFVVVVCFLLSSCMCGDGLDVTIMFYKDSFLVLLLQEEIMFLLLMVLGRRNCTQWIEK